MTDTTKTGGQTRDTQAINALIEAVSGGAISTSLIEEAMDTSWEAVMVLASFDGEMDASLCLLGHLLPGWSWKVESHKSMSIAWVGRQDEMLFCLHESSFETPARALLLATLKAWKETR